MPKTKPSNGKKVLAMSNWDSMRKHMRSFSEDLPNNNQKKSMFSEKNEQNHEDAKVRSRSSMSRYYSSSECFSKGKIKATPSKYAIYEQKLIPPCTKNFQYFVNGGDGTRIDSKILTDNFLYYFAINIDSNPAKFRLSQSDSKLPIQPEMKILKNPNPIASGEPKLPTVRPNTPAM